MKKNTPDFKVACSELRDRWQCRDNIQGTALCLLFNGQKIFGQASQEFQLIQLNLESYPGKWFFLGLVEEAFRNALGRRWPKWKRFLQEVRITSYAVHIVGDCRKYQIQVHLRARSGKKYYKIKKQGIDERKLIEEAVAELFCKRMKFLLRRKRGMEEKQT